MIVSPTLIVPEEAAVRGAALTAAYLWGPFSDRLRCFSRVYIPDFLYRSLTVKLGHNPLISNSSMSFYVSGNGRLPYSLEFNPGQCRTLTVYSLIPLSIFYCLVLFIKEIKLLIIIYNGL
jgi:hypothetical protein